MTATQRSLWESITNGKRLMFVGAHPDDETLVDPLLAYAAEKSKAKVLHFTRGKSGYNRTGPEMDHELAKVRSAEMAAAAEVLGVEHDFLSFYNGFPYPAGTTGNSVEEAVQRWKACGAGDETPERAVARWCKQGPDPHAEMVRALEEWKPAIVITFDTEFGYTGHREHCAVGIIVTKALREDAHWRSDWRPESLYYVVHRDHYAEGEHEVITPADLCPENPGRYLDIALRSFEQHESQFGRNASQDPERMKFFTPAMTEMHFVKGLQS